MKASISVEPITNPHNNNNRINSLTLVIIIKETWAKPKIKTSSNNQLTLIHFLQLKSLKVKTKVFLILPEKINNQKNHHSSQTQCSLKDILLIHNNSTWCNNNISSNSTTNSKPKYLSSKWIQTCNMVLAIHRASNKCNRISMDRVNSGLKCNLNTEDRKLCQWIKDIRIKCKVIINLISTKANSSPCSNRISNNKIKIHLLTFSEYIKIYTQKLMMKRNIWYTWNYFVLFDYLAFYKHISIYFLNIIFISSTNH